MLIFEVILISLLAVSTNAQDYTEYWGNIFIGGDTAENGLSVRAYINNQEFARMPGGTLNGYYYIKIPVDNPNTAEKEGGANGDKLTVEIHNIPVNPQINFEANSLQRIDLAINCIESWECNSWSECLNGIQTRTCTDVNNCGTAIDRPQDSKACIEECTPNWRCTEFESCTSENIKTRACTDLNQCDTQEGKPIETESCQYQSICVSNWQCTTFSTCSNNNQKTRTCIDLQQCNTLEGKPAEIEVCIYHPPIVDCIPSWQCTSFSECNSNNQKIRTCMDLQQCNTLANKPAEIESCQYQEQKEDKERSKSSSKSKKDTSSGDTEVIYIGSTPGESITNSNTLSSNTDKKQEKNNIKKIQAPIRIHQSKKTSKPNFKPLIGIILALYLIMIAMALIVALKMKRFIRKKAYLHFMRLHKNPFKIIVKPNSPRSIFLGYDPEKDAYRIAIKAKPEANKANIEVIKFFSKLLKKKVKIIKGLKTKEKVIKVG